MSDTIFIKGLLIHARHGVMDHEDLCPDEPMG